MNLICESYKIAEKQFDEKSLAVEIMGVDFKDIFEIAKMLRKDFNQEAVLVKDYKTNIPYIVEEDDNWEKIKEKIK